MVEMRRTSQRWLLVILVLNLLCSALTERMSHMYVETKRLIILFAWRLIRGRLALSKLQKKSSIGREADVDSSKNYQIVF